MAEEIPTEEEAPAETGLEVEPGRVAVTDGRGVQTLPIEQYEAAKEQGFRPATKAEWRAEKEGAIGSVKAGVYGAARGLSFGLSDVADVEVARAIYGEEGAELAREELEGQREAHPTITTTSEIAGSLAPLMLGAAPAEAAVAGEGLLARAGSRFVANAPRLFGEGVALAEGHQLTEDTLGNHELVAGKYLAAGLEGGLVNLVLGSALHAAGGAVFDKLTTRAAASTGEGLAERGVGKLRALAEEQAAKGAMPAAGIGASEMSRLGRTAEEQATRVRQVGRTLLDEGITSPLAGKALQAERLTKRVAEVGAEIGAIRKSFASSAVVPSAENVVRRITDEVIAPLVSRPFSEAEQRSVAPFVDEIFSKFGKDGAKGTTFEQLHELREALDGKLKKFWKMPIEARPDGLEEVAKVRRILESEYEAAADRAASLVGEETATKYRVAKALFGDLKTAEGWARKAAGRETQHRAISLTDTIMAGAGLASGHGALAIGATVGNKAMRTYGNQTAAVILDRVSKLEALQSAAAAYDTKLTGSVESFFGKRKAPSATAKRVAITPEQRVALRMAAQNPAALAEHIGDNLARQGLNDAAPNVARAMVLATTRAAQWIAMKLPPEPSRVGVAFGPSKPRSLGPRGQAELERAVRSLDADAMLDDLAHRRLSREQVEALKFVNPPLWNDMRSAVRAYGQANNPSLTIQHEVAMSIVFDTPVSSYTRGATIRGFQEAFAQGAPSETASAGGQTGKPIGSGRSKAAESLASPTDRAEAQGEL